MNKRYLIYGVVAALVFGAAAFMVTIELNALMPPLARAMSRQTGVEARIGRVTYRAPNRLVLHTVVVGDYLSIGRVTIWFNPLRGLLHMRDRAAFIGRVDIENPLLFSTPQLKQTLRILSTNKSSLAAVPVHLVISHGKLNMPFVDLADVDADITAGSDTAGTLRARLSTGAQVTLGVHAQNASEQTLVRLSAKVKSSATEIEAVGDLRHGAAGSSLHLTAPLLRYHGFTFDRAELKGQLHEGGVLATITQGGSRVSCEGAFSSSITATASLIMNELRPDATGTFTMSAVFSTGTLRSAFEGRSLIVAGVEYGDISAYIAATRRQWSANVRSLATGLTLAAESTNGAIQATLSHGRITYGTLNGSIQPFNLNLDLSKLPVSLIPGLHRRYSTVHGVVSGTATITSNGYDAFLGIIRLKSDKTFSPLTGSIKASKQGAAVEFMAETLQKDLSAHVSFLPGGAWSVSIDAERFPAANLVPWFYPEIQTSGTLSGKATYNSRSRQGYIDVRVLGPSLNDFAARHAEIVADIDPQRFLLKRCSIRASSGTLTASGSLTLPETGSGEGRFILAIKDFGSGNFRGNAMSELNGTLTRGKAWEFAGKITGHDIWVNDLSPQRLSAEFRCSSRQVQLSEIALGTLARGQLFVNIADRTLQAAIDISGLNLKDIFIGIPELELPLSASIAARGSIHMPETTIRLSSPEGTYRGEPFSCSALFHCTGVNRVRCENAVVRSGRTVITCNGALLPGLSAELQVQNLSCATASSILRLPVRCSGEAQGTVVARGTFASPRADVDVAIKDASVGRVRAGEVRAAFQASPSGIHVRTGLIKTAVSEIRCKQGTQVDLAKHAYKGVFEVVGLRLGPVDIFTSTCVVSGMWTTSDRTITSITADMRARNVWLNKTMVPAVNSTVVYRGNTITFAPVTGTGLGFDGTLSISTANSVTSSSFVFTHPASGSSIELSGTFDGDMSDMRMSARHLDAELCADVLELPFTTRGTISAEASLSGSVDRPVCDVTLNAENGSVGGLPFDRLACVISARQDVLTIVKAEMLSAAHYTMGASGYMPFALTASARRRVQNNPVDVSLSLQKGSLSVLRYLVKGIPAASGDVHARLRVTGTFARPLGNGYLKMNKGMIESDRYIRTIKGLVVDCLWKNNTIILRDIHGKSGGGDIRAKGTVAMDGLRPKNFDITVKTPTDAGVPVVVPQLPIPSPSPVFKTERIKMLTNYSHGEPRFDLRLSGSWDEPLISGVIELANTRFAYPPAANPDAPARMPGKPSRLKLDLELKTGKNCWYDNALVSVNIHGGMTLKGKAVSPAVAGHIDAVRGSIVYLGSEFTIKQAALDIAHDACYLSGEAETEVGSTATNDTDTISVVVDKAEITKIQPRFLSKKNPQMTPEKAMAVAVALNTEGESSDEVSFLSRRALIRLIDASLTTPLATSLLKRSGLVDTISVVYRPDDSSTTQSTDNATIADYLKGTSYTMGKNLGTNVNLGYTLTIDQVQNKLDLRHDLELSYYLQKNLMIKGAYQLENRTDLRDPDRRVTIEHKVKFGTPGK